MGRAHLLPGPTNIQIAHMFIFTCMVCAKGLHLSAFIIMKVSYHKERKPTGTGTGCAILGGGEGDGDPTGYGIFTLKKIEEYTGGHGLVAGPSLFQFETFVSSNIRQ